MELKRSLQMGFSVFLLGIIGFYLAKGSEAALWYSIGGGLALLNTFFVIWTLRRGLHSLTRKAHLVFLLMFKSMSFLMVVAVVLMFLKPLLLPFTLGLGIVIFGSVGTAFWEIRHLLKQPEDGNTGGLNY